MPLCPFLETVGGLLVSRRRRAIHHIHANCSRAAARGACGEASTIAPEGTVRGQHKRHTSTRSHA